ncbi:MAG: hypothetical protein HZY76_11295 [Anaerolineae bacterium]|nr:MAG: hypothetical protein HZY76_11295 [Anaerolineae bacterium]
MSHGISVGGKASPCLEKNTCEGNKGCGICLWGDAGGTRTATPVATTTGVASACTIERLAPYASVSAVIMRTTASM